MQIGKSVCSKSDYPKIRKKASKYIWQILRCRKPEKIKKAEELLGYTREDIRAHLKKQFSTGMNWRNYGDNQDHWNVDHIKPVIEFVEEGVDDIKQINALENLQPLWVVQNNGKGRSNSCSLKKK